MTHPNAQSVPVPLADDVFAQLRSGISDAPDVGVFVNEDRSFAYLDPQPSVEYSSYAPRHATLGLSKYKSTLAVIARRYEKIRHVMPEKGAVLEIGAAEGGFLRRAHEDRPDVRYFAVEPDEKTAAQREELPWLTSYWDLGAAVAAGIKADLVCLFHVFEHIKAPAEFLASVRQVLAPRGRILIEVPSLDDPLLTIYGLPAYEAFYFQRQHPFVYTGRSLARVLAANGFTVQEVLPYQRYGLENHLGWLKNGKPGGDSAFAEAFAGIDGSYRATLESRGTADTVFVVGEIA
ncbi:class I SAM-dependent methyltransferase [Hyphomicrobium sp.]|uniref:class I SAM-dependent methyltransferase n=1 Tax=Hyphomicrobium sp. TaxID=82 RepID=UPI0025B84D57|nr:class I SAM-dependent methyltransferase [Hyphomicrobium sp.]MCC7250940.1 class I SAM-dependent methyltransferase [Hyphomicrobium sp.]